MESMFKTTVNCDIYHVVEKRAAHEPLPIMYNKGDMVEVLTIEKNPEYLSGGAALVQMSGRPENNWIDVRFLSKHDIEWTF